MIPDHRYRMAVREGIDLKQLMHLGKVEMEQVVHIFLGEEIDRILASLMAEHPDEQPMLEQSHRAARNVRAHDRGRMIVSHGPSPARPPRLVAQHLLRRRAEAP